MSAKRVVFIILAGLALIGLFRLRIDVDVLNLLPSGSPVAKGLAVYQEKFLQAGELIIVVRSPSAETTLAAATSVVQQVRVRSNLVARAFWQPPANESLDDAARFVSYLWLNSSISGVAELQRNLRGENLASLLQGSRERIATSFNPSDLFLLPRDPLNLSAVSSAAGDTLETPDRFFSSADGLTRLVYVYSAVPLNNYQQCHDWVREMRRLISLSLPGLAGVDVLLTGRPVFVDEISSGMRGDMSTAVPGTLLMIGLLFYLLHREWISLLLLLAALFGIMIWAALAGSALIGSLNVVSVGFASILLGLAEDFGIVLHQETKNHPELDAAGIRRVAGPGIFWSAVTTASAFALLNLSALPGLRNLGTLVALGIVIGAWAMLYLFLPLLLRFRRGVPSPAPKKAEASPAVRNRRSRLVVMLTAALLLISTALLFIRPPSLDSSPNALRPRKSEANTALRIVQDTIGASGDPFWLLISGDSTATVRGRLETLNAHFQEKAPSLRIQNYTLPLSIWPDVASQGLNLPVLRAVAQDRERIGSAVLSNGFAPEALEFAFTVFDEWQTFSTNGMNWPRGRIAEWVLPKFVARTESNVIALGLITPAEDFRASEIVPSELKGDVLLSGWSLLGQEVLEQVQRETPLITSLVGLTILCALWLTFRRVQPVLLSLAVLAFSALLLMAMMGILGWRWNLINLTALPLLLGMGIDYSIHMQTALDRFGGSAVRTFQSVGRALLLAGSTTIIGFAFLGLSSNDGMASLGRVCALGLTILLLTSVFLLPGWTNKARARSAKE
jgi:uncharacterized protein